MFINYIIVRVGISEWFTKRLSEFCYNQKTEQWSSTRSRGTAITAWYLVFENNHLMISSYALFLTILFLNANIFKWYKFSLSKRLFPLFLLGRFFGKIFYFLWCWSWPTSIHVSETASQLSTWTLVVGRVCLQQKDWYCWHHHRRCIVIPSPL